MERHLRAVRNDPELRRNLVERGLVAIRARHSCRHRVEELLAILARTDARAALELSA